MQGVRVSGLLFMVWGKGLGFRGFGFWVPGLGFRISGLGFRV